MCQGHNIIYTNFSTTFSQIINLLSFDQEVLKITALMYIHYTFMSIVSVQHVTVTQFVVKKNVNEMVCFLSSLPKRMVCYSSLRVCGFFS